MNKEEILKLAELARLDITDEEAEAYKKDFEGILNYIDTIKNVDIEADEFYETNFTRNSMRDDNDVYEAGSFTKDILAEAPNREGDYFKVKKVL
jgi:aspartyl-tRNA(Asn)/glutamyl-tRNA(Gln) amidotransferase subunit C